MNKTNRRLRVTAGIVGVALLGGLAGISAASADDSFGDESVDVSVAITEKTGPGILALSVEADSTVLTEIGSTELIRQFTGTLPTVTVIDTRDTDEIPAGAAWYVLGSATDFTGSAGESPIGPEFLGWAPQLIDVEPGSVSEGDPTFSVVDTEQAPNNVGLEGEELFAMASDSAAIVGEGEWSANANLNLRIPVTTDTGNYTSTITLSLFE